MLFLKKLKLKRMIKEKNRLSNFAYKESQISKRRGDMAYQLLDNLETKIEKLRNEIND